MRDLRGQRLTGRFCHAPVLGELDVFEGTLDIDDDGVIAAVTRGPAPERAGTFILPGFVDLHIHAPQYPQLGRALNAPLETWLHDIYFPTGGAVRRHRVRRARVCRFGRGFAGAGHDDGGVFRDHPSSGDAVAGR